MEEIREVQRARRTRMPLAIAFVDVNHLKAVNDTHGHLAGDALLKQVAEALRTKLRPYDVIAIAPGGDEFVCALANMDAEDVRGRFADIVETLEANGFATPISYGVADLEETDDLERLLRRADEDLIETRRNYTGRASSAHPSSRRGRSARSAAKDNREIAQQTSES